MAFIGRFVGARRAEQATSVSQARPASPPREAQGAAPDLRSRDAVGRGESQAGRIPEPHTEAAPAGSRIANMLKFKGTRLKMQEAMQPSEARLQAKVDRIDARTPAALEKRNEQARATLTKTGGLLENKDALRTTLAQDDALRGAIAPGVTMRRTADGRQTPIDRETGEPATFVRGASVGALDGLTASAAERAGMSVEAYKNPGTAAHLRATAAASPAAAQAGKTGLTQLKLNRDAQRADDASDRLEKRRQKAEGNSVVKGGTRYYDPVAKIDDPRPSRADQVALTNNPMGMMDLKNRLNPAPVDASLGAGKKGSIETQLAKRDARASELEQKFPAEHNATLQAKIDRDRAQRTLVGEGVQGATNGALGHAFPSGPRSEQHVGYNVGRGVGESVKPETVNKTLQTQANLETTATGYAKTRGELLDIRKQEAFEGMTNARPVGKDVFYDAAESPAEIAAREKRSLEVGKQNLPQHTVFNPDRGTVTTDEMNLLPSGLRDGFNRATSGDYMNNLYKMPQPNTDPGA